MQPVLIRGGEKAETLLKEGHGIVHFLTNPLRSCVIYRDRSKEHPIATNIGRLAHGFESYVAEPLYYGNDTKYVIPYMADEQIIFRMRTSVPANAEKQFLFPGFCELAFDDGVEGIIADFENSDYRIVETGKDFSPIWNRVLQQRKKNLEARAAEIRTFYFGRRDI